MFELVYHQSGSLLPPIKSYYASLGAAYLAGKKVRQSGIFKLEILNPVGKPVLVWK